jgi:hypothetical protein
MKILSHFSNKFKKWISDYSFDNLCLSMNHRIYVYIFSIKILSINNPSSIRVHLKGFVDSKTVTVY